MLFRCMQLLLLDAETNEESYEELRVAVLENWATMKEYYIAVCHCSPLIWTSSYHVSYTSFCHVYFFLLNGIICLTSWFSE